MFSKILDNTRQSSLANKFRLKRFKYFTELIAPLPKPVKILDVGGTENFWLNMGLAGNHDYSITIFNITESDVSEKENMIFVIGDAADLSIFDNKCFDVVFSNSVIEHIPDKANRKKMADEIIRTGKKHFVQTPNYYFPFEPHFLFPFFQFMPQKLKILLLMKFNMGWFKKCSSRNGAIQLLEQNQLLKFNEFRSYFPDSRIIKERFLMMTKSFIALN